jgi:type I restriction enzyme S subunit
MTQVTRKIPKGYKQTEIGVITEDWELVNYDKSFNFLSTAAYSRSQLGTDRKVRYTL